MIIEPTMEWVEQAEAYIGAHGWGARGKSLGISRMYGDNDKPMFRKEKLVASQRPRGVLSGFLAIVPNLGYAVYLPPIAAKMGPLRIRMRLSQTLLMEGAILSAYCLTAHRSESSQKPPFGVQRTLIIDDILLWHGKHVWSTTPFKTRWESMMSEFRTDHYKPLTDLQGVKIDFASYVPLASFTDAPPDPTKVVEFVPNTPNTKRIVWIPPVQSATPVVAQSTPKTEQKPNTTHQKGGEWLIAKKELGPDVFSVWRALSKGDEERLGLALIRTLAISRAMRLNYSDEGIKIRADYNNQFDKWEIQEVQEKK